jgi:hypothetical protein
LQKVHGEQDKKNRSQGKLLPGCKVINPVAGGSGQTGKPDSRKVARPEKTKRGNEMKTMADLETRFRNELNQWFIRQSRDIYADFYLYYLPTTAEHDGHIAIFEEDPPNPEYVLACGMKINKGAEINQLMNQWRPILRTLPVLEY